MVACARVVAQANLLWARQPPAGEVESYAPYWEALGSFMIDNYERGAYAYVSRAGRGKDEHAKNTFVFCVVRSSMASPAAERR